MTILTTTPPGFVRGQMTGADFPADAAALERGGAPLLTWAFHAFGVLPADNAVQRIVRIAECPGGSTGAKLFLTVEYTRPAPGLHTELFAKFSRNAENAYFDMRGRQEMQGEIRFAGLYRTPAFPVRVPRPYFADMAVDLSAGLLITERIAFGSGGIEPQYPKCSDHVLDDPPAYYRALVTALAEIAAAHRAGRLGDIERLFPYDAEALLPQYRLRHDEAQIRAHIRHYADFAKRHKQLFPADFSPELFADLEDGVARFVEHQDRINRYLLGNADYVALCHWNAHVDNAWFWRDADNELQCGLIDWGRTSQMNLVFALWGCLSGASLAIWDEHLEELLALFASVLHAKGGPRLDPAELRLQLQLHVTMMCLSHMLGSLPMILADWPEIGQASGPLDEGFRHHERARNQLSISIVFLNFWRRYGITEALNRII